MKRTTLAALAALLCAGPAALAAGALFLRVHNRAEHALATAPSTAAASFLARRAAAARTPDEARAGLRALTERAAPLADTLGGIRSAMIIAEPRSTKYRFLRKRRYLAHTEQARAGQTLDGRSSADKVLHDLAATVRRSRRARVELDSRPGAPLRVTAAAPVLRDGRHVATAVVVVAPALARGLPRAWPLPAGLLLCAVFIALAGATARRRWSTAIALGAAFSAGAALWLVRVGAALAGHVDHASRSLAGALDATPGAIARPAVGGWGILVFAAAIGVGLGVLGRRGYGGRIVAVFRRHRLAYALLAPALLGMLVLVVVPFAYGLGLGFYDHAHGVYTFVGLRNFVEILAGDRPLSHPLNFYFTLGVTLLWTLVNVVLHVTIGLALALLLKDPTLRFRGAYRALLILPWAVPNYITALVWKGMFHYQFGAVNHALSFLGIEKISWFSSFSTAFCANVTTNTWLGFPFMMLVSLGALQSIPGELYEAAAVDGASRRQAFFRITLPLLRPALVPAVVLGSIWTFNMFNIIYLVSGGEPAGATDILVTEGYRWAFERADRYGLAAAYALLVFVILLAYTMLTRRVLRGAEERSR